MIYFAIVANPDLICSPIPKITDASSASEYFTENFINKNTWKIFAAFFKNELV